MNRDTGYDLLDTLQRCLDDAAKVAPVEDWEVFSHPQTWPNTGCGFPGIAGQAFTSAQTFALHHADHGARVYHNGRFAYAVERPSQDYYDALRAHHLPGVCDPRTKMEAAR